MMIKFPIVIISSPRSGSTPLAFELKNKHNVELFNEPFSQHSSKSEPNDEEKTRLISLLKNNDSRFILKIHLDDLKFYPEEIIKLIETHNCHLIRIRRRDIVKQCVSLYIELQRNIWGYYKDFINQKEIDSLTDTSLPINQSMIKHCVKRITKVNGELNSLSYVFDQDVWYEDLVFDETFIITPKPNNYDIIKEKIEKIL
jgi:LPS sulfotransferase NodH